MKKTVLQGGLFLVALMLSINAKAQTYCEVSTSYDEADYLTKVSSSSAVTNVLYNASSFPTGSLADETAQAFESFESQTFNIHTVYPTEGTGVYIWVDWDNDFIFDENELVASSSTQDKNKTLSVTVPAGTPQGDYRMRIRGAYMYYIDIDSPPACGSIAYGSTIDFTLTIIEPPCLKPSSLTASNITDSDLDLGWTENSTATEWNIEYGISGYTQGNGTEESGVTTNPYTLTGLTAETAYEFYVQSDCGIKESDWAGPFAFSTLINCNTSGGDVDITVCMNEPVDLDTIRNTGSDAGGTWLDSGDNILTSSEITLLDISGLYRYSYITTSNNCPADTADISITVDEGCDYLSTSKEMLVDVSVYPNPATAQLNIVNPSNISSLRVEMLDMNGRVVLIENKALDNATEAALAIDRLERGIYTLRVYNDEVQKTFKIVKQ